VWLPQKIVDFQVEVSARSANGELYKPVSLFVALLCFVDAMKEHHFICFEYLNVAVVNILLIWSVIL